MAETLYIVKAPRVYQGKEGYNVFSLPASKEDSQKALELLKTANPGVDYYVDRYEE